MLILRLIMTRERSNSIEHLILKNSIKDKYNLDKLLCNNSEKTQWLDDKWKIISNFLRS